ncbi:glycosyltransferase [uncultured Phenylobacterium sp.]|uniref:glycosyltransferase family 2 protein n=1 Tax=uncultured Phenylobacterium sp. TaxID=349273 RepID=UPI0025F9A830|nr:glycosyltransferase [uncultured Phenylobacterium sp.]
MTDVNGMPLVSVVLPTYNRARTLPRAIHSVLNQGYSNIELIVVDDASTDDTDALMASLHDPRIRYIKMEKNRGQCAARNIGLQAATGEFIAYQDSDDEWLADKLQRQMDAVLTAGKPDVTCFHMRIIYGRDANRVYGKGRSCCVPEISQPEHARDYVKMTHLQNLMAPQVMLISRSLVDKAGPWDELLVNSVDWDYSLRLVSKGHVIYIDEPLVVAYIQNDSISTMKKNMVRSQLRILLKLNRQEDVDRNILSHHFARIGTSLGRFGKPRSADKFLRRALWLAPGKPKNWARLAVNVLQRPSMRRPAKALP